jgi:hypothetical protein
VRFVLGQRIRDARVGGIVARDERQRADLEETLRCQRVLDLRNEDEFRRVRHIAYAERAKLIRERVIPMQASDLFDHVDLRHDILTPAWRGNRNLLVTDEHLGARPDLRREADGTEQLDDSRRHDRFAEHLLHARRSNRERAGLDRSRIDVDRGLGNPAGQRRDERDCLLQPLGCRGDIGATFEAIRGLGTDRESAAHVSDTP